MGWVSYLFSQAIITSVALGALKRHGVINVQPAVIQNDTARYVLTQAVYLGEETTLMVERLFASVREEIDKRK